MIEQDITRKALLNAEKTIPCGRIVKLEDRYCLKEKNALKALDVIQVYVLGGLACLKCQLILATAQPGIKNHYRQQPFKKHILEYYAVHSRDTTPCKHSTLRVLLVSSRFYQSYYG